jgi:hypothetical protein
MQITQRETLTFKSFGFLFRWERLMNKEMTNGWSIGGMRGRLEHVLQQNQDPLTLPSPRGERDLQR